MVYIDLLLACVCGYVGFRAGLLGLAVFYWWVGWWVVVCGLLFVDLVSVFRWVV